MTMVSRLDLQLAKRKMKSKELSERISVTVQTVSRMKTGKIKAIRVDEPDAICRELGCGVGDLYEHVPEEPATVLAADSIGIAFCRICDVMFYLKAEHGAES